MRSMYQVPGVQVVALVPAAGPVPPADHGRDAAHQRVFDLLRTNEVNMRIDAGGVAINPSPAMTSVPGPPRCRRPAEHPGFTLADATMRPCLMPMSALMMPQ